MFMKVFRMGIAVTAGLMLSSQAFADNFTLRIGSGHPPALGFTGIADSYFVPEVTRRAKAMGHNVRFIKAYAGTVAKVDGIVEAVQKGTLDIGLQATIFDTERGALFNFSFYVPFTSSDYQLQQRVANRMLKEVPELRDSMKKYGIHVLNMSVFEDYGIISKTEIRMLDDIKGKKLALGAANANWMAAAGGVGINLPAGEYYQAIQSGLADGAVFFGYGLESFKLGEVAKYYLKPERGVIVGAVTYMNEDTRKKLPQDVVAMIDKVAEETGWKTTELSQQRDRDIEARAKTMGVKVSVLSAPDRMRWAEAMKGIPAAEAKRLDDKGLAGSTVLKAYIRLLKEEGYKFPVEYRLN